MKILQFCYKPPFPAKDGGCMGMHSINEGLRNNGCDVKIFTIYSDKHPLNMKELPEDYIKANRIEGVWVDLSKNVFDALWNVLIARSYVIQRFVTPEVKLSLTKILQSEKFDIVQIESMMLAPYIPLIRKHSKAKITFHCPNVEHLIWQRACKAENRNLLKKWYLKNTAMNMKAYEMEHIHDFDAIFPVTDIDAQFFRDNGYRRMCHSLPIGFDEIEPLSDVAADEDTVFHIGSMNWFPNIQGFKWFIDDIWPEIRKRTPKVQAYFAGRYMPSWMENGEWENVHIVGEVQDSVLFMSTKQIMVVPLLSGSGIRIKILEAMSIGKTVVATSVAAEGIEYQDGVNIVIANTPEEFAKAIEKLTKDKAYCKTVGDNAYNLIRDKYNTNYVARKLVGWYEKLLEE